MRIGNVRQPSPLLLFAIITAVGLALFPVAAGYVKRYSIRLQSAASIYGCFLLHLIYTVAPALPAERLRLGRFIAGRYRAFIIPGLLALPYLIYAAGTEDFRWFSVLRLMAIAAPVTVLYSALPVRYPAKLNWQDVVVAAWLVSAVLFHFLKGIWNVPVELDFMARLFMTSLGALCWTYVRPIPGLGYQISFDITVFVAAATNFVLFAAIAIPLSLVLGFTGWNPHWHGLLDFLLSYLQMFLFIAILEELFFRGFLQNLLSRSFHSWWRGQLVASCIFGLFHVLHAPFPNWRYVALASIAGWFYGSAYRATGTLLSSTLVHAMVDTLWRTFLTHR